MGIKLCLTVGLAGTSGKIGPEDGQRHRYRRSVDSADPMPTQEGGRHRRPGVAGGDHRRGLAVANGLCRPDQGRVLLAAHALSGVLVHTDDLGCRDQRKVTAALEVVGTDEQYWYALGRGTVRPGEYLPGSAVAPERIEGDGEHGRTDRLLTRRR